MGEEGGGMEGGEGGVTHLLEDGVVEGLLVITLSMGEVEEVMMKAEGAVEVTVMIAEEGEVEVVEGLQPMQEV
jgi:hypothetical protein